MGNVLLKKAYVAALLYAFIIGFSFVFVKLALLTAHPLDLLAHRFTVSFIAASAVIACRRSALKLSLKDIMLLIPLVLFNPILYFVLQTYGLMHISSSEAGIIQAMIPVMTMLLAAYWIKEVPSRWQKTGIGLSVMGVIYIFIMKGVDVQTASLTGGLLILLSSLAFAFYNVLGRKRSRQYHAMDITFLSMAGSFIVFNLLSVGRHAAEGTLATYFAPFSEPWFLVSILYLGIMSSLVTSFLTNYALTYLEASKLSVFVNLATLITVFAGVMMLGEKLYFSHIIGGIAILTGVLMVNVSRKRRKLEVTVGDKAQDYSS